MSREIGKRLGKRVRALREAAGLTQAQLASLSLKSVETISNFERGKTLPSILTLAALAPHLNVQLRDFFDFEVPVKPKPADTATAAIKTRSKLLSPRDQKLAADFIEFLISRRRKK